MGKKKWCEKRKKRLKEKRQKRDKNMNRKKNDKMRMKKRKDKNEKEKDCWIRQRMSQDVTVFSNDRSKRRIRQQLIHLEKVTCLQGQLLHQHRNFFSLLLLKRHF